MAYAIYHLRGQDITVSTDEGQNWSNFLNQYDLSPIPADLQGIKSSKVSQDYIYIFGGYYIYRCKTTDYSLELIFDGLNLNPPYYHVPYHVAVNKENGKDIIYATIGRQVMEFLFYRIEKVANTWVVSQLTLVEEGIESQTLISGISDHRFVCGGNTPVYMVSARSKAFRLNETLDKLILGPDLSMIITGHCDKVGHNNAYNIDCIEHENSKTQALLYSANCGINPFTNEWAARAGTNCYAVGAHYYGEMTSNSDVQGYHDTDDGWGAYDKPKGYFSKLNNNFIAIDQERFSNTEGKLVTYAIENTMKDAALLSSPGLPVNYWSRQIEPVLGFEKIYFLASANGYSDSTYRIYSATSINGPWTELWVNPLGYTKEIAVASPPPELVVTAGPLPDVCPFFNEQNSPYSDNSILIENGAPPYTAEFVNENDVPTGLTVSVVDSNVVLSGPISEPVPGTYNFSIIVTDDASDTETVDVSITVTLLIDITTLQLNNFYINNSYSDTVVVVGGSNTYTFQLTTGNLPDGLTLDENTGNITGTPTELGVFTFTVRATDSVCTHVTDDQEYTIQSISTEDLSLDDVDFPTACV